jgi:hypothetical protein
MECVPTRRGAGRGEMRGKETALCFPRGGLYKRKILNLFEFWTLMRRSGNLSTVSENFTCAFGL